MRLNPLGAFDAEPAQYCYQLPQSDGRSGQQEGFARRVFLGEDVVMVIEVAELLGQLKRMPGEVGRFRRCDALIEHHGAAAGAKPESPDVLVVVAGDKAL